jgi:hypothetical protein
MRSEIFLGLAALSLVLGGACVRILSRRELLIQLLFLFAAVSYLVRHFTDSTMQ